MNDIELMKRHLGEPQAVKLGEDDIWLAPLRVEDMPELIAVQSELETTVKNGQVIISKELAKRCIDLLVKSIMEASPEIDSDIVKKLVSQNLIALLPGLFKVNNMAGEREIRKAEKMAKVKARISGNE